MESVHDLAVPEVIETKAAPRWPRWAIPVVIGLGLNLAVLTTLSMSVQRLADELLRLESANGVAAADVVRALDEQSASIETELRALTAEISTSQVEELLFLQILVLEPNLDRARARKIAAFVHHYSQLHEQDPQLVLSVMDVESRFDPRAESPVGALGLMQVMPQWKKVLGIPGDLRDIETSIKYGVKILGMYQQMYRKLDLALTAYNRGPGAVDRALMKGKSPFNGYAARVMKSYRVLKSLKVQSI